MKWHPILIWLIFPWCGSGQAQQNLFNVPSADVTAEDELFFQQQMGLAASVLSSHTTLSYGLGNDFEIGANVFNVDLHSGPNEPLFLFNFQKGFSVTKSYKISIGTQIGASVPLRVPEKRVSRFANFSYLSSSLDLENRGKYYLGIYYVNKSYAGGNAAGLMAGLDYPLMERKVHLMGDFVSGKNAMSVAVLGAVFYMPRNWIFSMGAQLPSPGSKNHYGMVFELTKDD